MNWSLAFCYLRLPSYATYFGVCSAFKSIVPLRDECFSFLSWSFERYRMKCRPFVRLHCSIGRLLGCYLLILLVLG